MSNVGDALSGGGSSATGVTDSTFSDASLGDQIMGGDGSLGTGTPNVFGAGSGPSEFSQFSDIANALNSGAPVGSSPTTAQSVSMTPPSVAAATGGDPAGESGGTQSNTAPGASPNQNQQQQSGGGQQIHDPDHAPPSAVAELKTLLKGLSGQPTGPTGPVPTSGPAPFALPTLAPGQTGRPSFTPAMIGGMPNEGGIANLPTLAPGETLPGAPPPGVVTQVVGAPPAQARVPPDAASQPGRDITVQPRATQAQPPQGMPAPQNEPGEVAPGGPALPTHKPTQPEAEQPTEPEQPAAAPAPPRLLQDITGASTGAPTALADLAQAARVIAPLLPLIAGMFGGGGGRRFGRFHGGRFTHGVGRGGFNGFRGGVNAMHYHGGQHPAGRGAWPYHHPQFGWHMHPRPPGPGWLPLNPLDAQALVGGGQDPNQDPNQPDPNAPPKETGRTPGTPDQIGSSGAIPGASAKDVDAYTRQVAQGYGIDPDVASKILAQESSYGQTRQPGDNGTSFGPFQLHFAPDGKAMGDQFRRDTGLDPRDPRTWKQQVDYAMMKASQEGWTPWTTTMKKLGMNQWSGITTNRRYAGRMSNKPLARETTVTPDMLAKLPPSSQPMVAGP
jgi:hypothetical protein